MKKLVQKLVSRDTLNYRKITDKPVPAKDEKDDKEEDDSYLMEDDDRKTADQTDDKKEVGDAEIVAMGEYEIEFVETIK